MSDMFEDGTFTNYDEDLRQMSGRSFFHALVLRKQRHLSECKDLYEACITALNMLEAIPKVEEGPYESSEALIRINDAINILRKVTL